MAVLAGCGGSSGSAASRSSVEPSYGTLPSFLPTPTVVANSELTGTAADPAVTSQGDSVLVKLSGGAVHARVTGPMVPGEGLPVVQEATTCTWTVTLAGATTLVPVRVGDFTVIDHLGKIYLPAFVPGQPKPPATLQPGKSTTFELRAIMNAGEGLMRWAPEGTTLA